MPFLPVAERELRVTARGRETYRVRFFAVLTSLLILAWQLIVQGRLNIPAAEQGKMLFSSLASLALVYCAAIGARATADSISHEKREGTLGLLFLTDLKSYDIILGKLVAGSLNAFYGLLAIIPMLTLPLLLGGVTRTQVVQTSIALVNALFFSVVVGIFVSTFSRNERKAMFFTVVFLLVSFVGPFVFGVWLQSQFHVPDSSLWQVFLYSPAFAFGVAAMGNPPGIPWPSFGFSVGSSLTFSLSVLLLAVACRKLPASWQEKGGPRGPRRPGGEKAQRRRSLALDLRRRLLDENAFLWLSLRGEDNKPRMAWIFVGSMVAIWIVGGIQYGGLMFHHESIVPLMLVFHTFLKCWLASESCARIIEDRRSGALELLLSTPLSVPEIVRGQQLAVRRQFLKPALVLAGFELLICAILAVPSTPSAALPRLVLTVFSTVVIFFADCVTMNWLGMYFALTARSYSRALGAAIGMVMGLPFILFQSAQYFISIYFEWQPNAYRPYEDRFPTTGPFLWLLFALTADGAIFTWARHRVMGRFRTIACEAPRAVVR